MVYEKLLWPVDRAYPVSQRYGENPQDYNGVGHKGWDVACPNGTDVVSMLHGECILAGWDSETLKNPKWGYGLHVRIKHPDGRFSIYGHLQKCLVNVGDKVNQGQIIGKSNNTGNSTGPHLHAECRKGAAFSTAYDFIKDVIYELPSTLPPTDDNDLFEVIKPLSTVQITENGDGLRIRSDGSLSGRIIRTTKSGENLDVVGLSDATWLLTPEGYIKYDPDWVKIVK